jgi:hypothetical protein
VCMCVSTMSKRQFLRHPCGIDMINIWTQHTCSASYNWRGLIRETKKIASGFTHVNPALVFIWMGWMSVIDARKR